MANENLDLTHLSVGEAERHVGHLLRQALSGTDIGALVIKSGDGGLLFLNAAVFLSRIETDELIQLLMDSKLEEEHVVDLIANLEELVEDADPDEG